MYKYTHTTEKYIIKHSQITNNYNE